MQGWESEYWLDLAKIGWEGGIPLIELRNNPRFPFHALLEDIDASHIQDFRESDQTDLKDWSARVFSNIFILSD